jgi:sulfite dehydrogenase (cytochrome) subunit B
MKRTLALAALLASCATFALVDVQARSIELPPDGTQLKASDLPGYAKAQGLCVACHSAEYMLYQPPNAGRAYWDTMVKRMKTVFKAPVPDDDIPMLVDYLVKTYGNEKGK